MIDFHIHPEASVALALADEGAAFAGAQLADYLSRILGRPMHATAGTGDVTIHLLCRLGVGLSDEGYRFETRGRSLHIIGGGALGVSYGVFFFLHHAGGCRFSGLAPDGEHVPQRDSLHFTDAGQPYEPILAYRGLQFTTLEPLHRQAARLDWMLKNGMNQVLIRFNPDQDALEEVDPQSGMRHAGIGSEGPRMSAAYVDEHLMPLILQRGLKIDLSHHNLQCWFSPTRLRDEHPEWFALRDGVRGGDLRQLCICTSNPQAVEHLIDRIDDYLGRHPQVQRVGVIPEDGLGACQCADCTRMDDHPDDATRPWLGLLHPQAMNAGKARRYALLLNQVAQAIKPRHPQVKIVGAAYVDLAAPPEDVDLADNVVLWLAIYWRDGARPLLAQGASPVNQRYRQLIQAWCDRMPGRIYLYEYYMGMNAQHSLPYPVSPVIIQDWLALSPELQGATIQCLTSLHEAYGLNLLTFARLGWQRHVHHDEVLTDWLEGMFGPAAQAVRPIFERWLEAVARITDDEARTQHPAAVFLDGDMLKPDARNIVYLMAGLPESWVGQRLASARRQATPPRVVRQLDRLAHYLSYCRQAARLVEAVHHGSAPQVANALQATVDHMEHPLAQGWIAPAHAIRWQRMAKPSLALETA